MTSLLLVALLVTAQPIPIYVTSIGAANGMTDPNKDNQDTAKDLRDALKGRPGLVLVNDREAATIVLIVQSREKAQITAGFLGAGRDCTVRVTFLYKDVEQDMSASASGGTLSSGGGWSRAAGKVAKQVEHWIKANREQLTTEVQP
jgi:hypothetical protein